MDCLSHQVTMELIVFWIFVAILIYRGLIVRKPGFATWHMFSNYSLTTFELFRGTQRINPWDYFPHTATYIHPYDVMMFLKYLREVKNWQVQGKITIRMNEKTFHCIVKNSDVVS